MTRGPIPKPTALKRLEGNPGKRRLNDREPQPDGLPTKPAFVTGEAAREWDRAVAAMPPGLYTAADSPVLAVYCLAWVSYRDAMARVARDGQVTKGANGQLVAHPSLGTAAKQAEIILRAADKLGMSPGARSRLQVQDKPPPSKFDGLLGKPRTGDLQLVQ